MKLNEYIKLLQEIAKTHGNADVVYAADDEGNRFSPIHYTPTPGFYDKREGFDDSAETINAVCIN